jgi:hypothetical protein
MGRASQNLNLIEVINACTYPFNAPWKWRTSVVRLPKAPVQEKKMLSLSLMCPSSLVFDLFGVRLYSPGRPLVSWAQSGWALPCHKGKQRWFLERTIFSVWETNRTPSALTLVMSRNCRPRFYHGPPFFSRLVVFCTLMGFLARKIISHTDNNTRIPFLNHMLALITCWMFSTQRDLN